MRLYFSILIFTFSATALFAAGEPGSPKVQLGDPPHRGSWATESEDFRIVKYIYRISNTDKFLIIDMPEAYIMWEDLDGFHDGMNVLLSENGTAKQLHIVQSVRTQGEISQLVLDNQVIVFLWGERMITAEKTAELISVEPSEKLLKQLGLSARYHPDSLPAQYEIPYHNSIFRLRCEDVFALSNSQPIYQLK